MSSQGTSQVRELIRRLRRQGFVVRHGKKHYKVTRDGNPKSVTMSVSPSDPCAIKNAMRDIRRVFDWREEV